VKLLACRRRFVLLRNNKAAKLAGVKWTADVVDPEFKKNVQIFARLIAGAIGICARELVRWTSTQVPHKTTRAQLRRRSRSGQSPTRTPADRDQLIVRLGDLRDLISLPKSLPLTLEALLGQRFELEQTLVELGDEEYVRSRAADLYDEESGTLITWQKLFGDVPPPLLEDAVPRSRSAGSAGTRVGTGTEGGEEQDPARGPGTDTERTLMTRRMVARLLAVKESTYLPVRARRELKQRILLTVVVPSTLLCTALFAVAIGTVEDEDDAFLLTAAGGAVGAALGGLIKLRDEISRGAEIREFAPFFLGQIIVGAAAGLLAFVTARAGIIELGGGTNGLAAFGFVAGFSEAAFVGIVGRIAGELGEREKENGKTEDAPNPSP
jgi:hypothetical protein